MRPHGLCRLSHLKASLLAAPVVLGELWKTYLVAVDQAEVAVKGGPGSGYTGTDRSNH